MIRSQSMLRHGLMFWELYGILVHCAYGASWFQCYEGGDRDPMCVVIARIERASSRIFVGAPHALDAHGNTPLEVAMVNGKISSPKLLELLTV